MNNRSFASGANATPPTAPASPSIGYPSDGNPNTGTPPTRPGEYWFHQQGEELRAVIVAAGLTPDASNLTQLLSALQSQGLFAGVASGDETFTSPTITSNVLTLNLGASRVFKVAANANITTTTIQNPPVSTKVGHFLVKYTADGTLRTWPWFTSTVIWEGSAPVLPTTSGKRLWALFWTDDGGTTWFGTPNGTF